MKKTTKKCHICKLKLPLICFHNHHRPNNIVPGCKKCRAEEKGKSFTDLDEHYIKAKKLRKETRYRCYNITKEQYFKIKETQNKVCAICFTPWDRVYRGLYIDHCHKTGRVRGLLCNRCNVILGKIKDDFKNLNPKRHTPWYRERVKAYLEATDFISIDPYFSTGYSEWD